MKPTYTVVVAALWAASASAQSAFVAPIDQELLGQLDFRTLAFKACFEVETCEVDGVKISGYRLETATDELVPAKLYWDPIDGIGVTLGGQNDEIDFDERVVVEFSEPRTVDRVWLSDLFILEHARYGGISVSGEDIEHARLELSRDGTVVGDMKISGEIILPDSPFNTVVSDTFIESGDLRRRAIVDEHTLALIIPGGVDGSDIVIDISAATVEDAKKDIFVGVPSIEMDLTDILAAFVDAPIFAPGTYNAERVLEMLNNDTELMRLNQTAVAARPISDKSNGEIGGVLLTPLTVDTLTFYTPFDTSNDYSVAGVVFQQQ